MGTPTVFRNQALEAKRKAAVAREKADHLLRARKVRTGDTLSDIDRALAGEPGGWLAAALLRIFRSVNKSHARRIAEFLKVIAAARSKLLEDDNYLVPLSIMARESWRIIRPVETWRPTTHNRERQFASLLRFAFTQYPLPLWLDGAWSIDSATHRVWRDWYVAVGCGENLRKQRGLPVPLTKKMAEHALRAPDHLSVPQAIRFGQVCGLGGTYRMAMEVLGSRIGTFDAANEPFWLTLLQLLAGDAMLDPTQVGPIIDYVHDRKFVTQPGRLVDGRFTPGVIEEPNFSMKGQTIESLLRQMTAWHRQLAHLPRGQKVVAWPSCGVPGMTRTEGSGHEARVYSLRELRSSHELFDEGKTMRHCVGSYTISCQSGRVGIYALRVLTVHGEQRLLTVEVNVRSKQITQARGKLNRKADAVEQRIVRAWATETGLSIASYVCGF